MNENRILERYPPGDDEARLLIAAARQLQKVFEITPWSVEAGRALLFLLSFRRFEFEDGTLLGDVSRFDSIIGKRQAALILAALDPDDRGASFWRRPPQPEERQDEGETEELLAAALARARIHLGR